MKNFCLKERIQYIVIKNKFSEEQSDFKPSGQLSTSVLSMHQEIKNNLAANVPTLAVYVDYKKAYDMIWNVGLIVKTTKSRNANGTAENYCVMTQDSAGLYHLWRNEVR